MNNGNIAKQVIAEELISLIYEIFFNHYGMDLKTDRQIPNSDLDVYRWYMSFEGKIDENKKIYRR